MMGKTCRFTGHRPGKLGMTEQQLRPLLEEAIRQAIKDGFTTFITGMAMGVDLVAGEIVLQLREQDSRLKLVCALPYPNFGQHWGGGWTKRFQEVLAAADLKRCICPSFYHASYQLRNEWMREIAESKGVSASCASETIGSAIRKLKKHFKKNRQPPSWNTVGLRAAAVRAGAFCCPLHPGGRGNHVFRELAG